jgi:import inner membrane translocase subunit TIM16
VFFVPPYLLTRAQFNAWRATSAATNAGGTVAGAPSATVAAAEAAKILNVSESATVEEVNQAFERMYEANSPEKGNSFYLQSK